VTVQDLSALGKVQ